MKRFAIPTVAFLAVLFASKVALATGEVCGDGQDNDGNGLTDEGCYPFLTTGVCESPLSCDADGAVAPKTGSLVYQLPPDIAPRVPYGPSIAFRRIYTSMYAPGGSAPAYRKPMGERWQHSYMSWLDKIAGSPNKIILHTNHGQDILFTQGTGGSGYDAYASQTGFHFQYLHQSQTSPYNYTLKTLNGDSFVYDGSTGKLIEIWDTLASPNKVLVAYDGNGMVSTVTDAAGLRRLLFGYTSGVLTSVQFQIYISPSWTTEHTTSYTYTGGSLTGVSIGGASAQTNVYTSGYLTQIQDAGGNNIASFAYLMATPGKVVQVSTPSGNVGYDYSSTRTVCSGKTVAYFNKGSTTACKVDSDCGSGYLCGGNTDPTATSGVCYLAARCLTTSSPSEDVVTSVSSFGPGGGACIGACLDAQAYSWNTGTGVLDLGAVQDPAGNYSARAFNSNGLPTTITFGDPDGNPANGNSTREVYVFYDSTFPGKISEVRRKSDLGTGTCSPTNSYTCARTLYTYNSDGLLHTVEDTGYTLDASGNVTTYDYTTTKTYDGQGRILQTDGPLAGADDVTVFEYWSSSDILKNGFLQNYKRKKDSTNYLVITSSVYDFWGHPTTTVAPDGSLTCHIFDSARGYLAERREAMAGQSSCTPDPSDLVTDYVRDSALRLTKTIRPDGGCVFNEYDTAGRLSKVKRRDDCVAANSGDNEEFTRNAEGLVTEIDWKDSTGTITRKQPLTYYQSRRLDTIMNPVNTAYYTTLQYDSRGAVNEIDGAAGLSKTTIPAFTADGRPQTIRRYKDSTTYDDWTLADSWDGILQQITDGQSKTISATQDDLGRQVKATTVDSGTTYLVHDAAGRVTSMVEAYGTAGQQTHTFTYDNLNRPLVSDYQGGHCDSSSAHPEIQKSFDSLPSGITCPSGIGCTRTTGRLAYVDTVLMCLSSQSDHQLDQETFFSYDDAGRVVREYIRDDTGRVADHQYSYDKDGHLTQVTLPSGAVVGWSYGSAGSNSDVDRIAKIWRSNTSTPIIDTVLWNPFGPFSKYNQENGSSGILYDTAVARNFAYRMVSVGVEYQTLPGHYVYFSGISEDLKGRTSRRVYTPSTMTYSYFKYDEQDRVTCETTDSVASCPTSGSDLKNNHSSNPPFTAGGNWKTLLRPIPGSTGLTHTFNCTGCMSQLDTFTDIAQSDGTPTLGTTTYGWDSRGNRTYDDNTSTLTYDRRDFTYDGRRNVVTVRGQYQPSGGGFRYYDVTSAYDDKNRRVFKSFYDESTLKTAQWFFYYDPMNRLTEVRYTPDISASSTYTVFQLFWLDDRLVLYWQTDYPSATTSRRYVGTDETGRPLQMMSWPSSGNSALVWDVNPSAWGFDTSLTGSSVYQPILFAGQYQDSETIAWQNDGVTVHRPGVAHNGFRTYDPFTGSYLQIDPLVDSTWDPYVYARSNPVGNSDPLGLDIVSWGGHLFACWGYFDDAGADHTDCYQMSFDEPDAPTPPGDPCPPGLYYDSDTGTCETMPPGGGGGGGGRGGGGRSGIKYDPWSNSDFCWSEPFEESCKACCNINYDLDAGICRDLKGNGADPQALERCWRKLSDNQATCINGCIGKPSDPCACENWTRVPD